MKWHLLLASCLLAPVVCMAESCPFDLSAAANKDVVYEVGGTARPFGGNPVATQCFVEDGWSDGVATAVGLPRQRRIVSNDADIGEYRLEAYERPNLIEVATFGEVPAENRRFEVPAKRYAKIGLVVAAVDGDASFTVKFHYSDGTVDPAWWEADDWYDLGPRGNQTKVLREMDRVEAATGKVEKSGHFHLYEFILDETRGLNSTKVLEAITIGNDPNRWPNDQQRWGGVFAAAGVAAE